MSHLLACPFSHSAASAAKAAGSNTDPILRPFIALGWAYTHANESSLGSFLFVEESGGWVPPRRIPRI